MKHRENAWMQSVLHDKVLVLNNSRWFLHTESVIRLQRWLGSATSNDTVNLDIVGFVGTRMFAAHCSFVCGGD